jgi:hypothetical protein
MSTSTPDPSSALLWFVILSIIYAIAEYFNGKNGGGKNAASAKAFFFIYVLAVFIGEFFINLNLTSALCGAPQWSTAMIVTGMPWILMFGTVVVLLNMFPGWLSPFSNTIGYGVAKLSGLGQVLDSIFAPNPKAKTAANEAMDEALTHIYSDRSLLVNEITLTNFDFFWDKMKGVFQTGVFANTDLKMQLWNMIWLKDVVGRLIWYLLTGATIVSVSYNYLVSSGCSLSVQEMDKRHDEYQKQAEEDRVAAAAKDSKQRIYSTLE